MSWATDRVHQDYSSTGKYNSSSALAKEYAGLEEDGGSRVDDGEGWREIKRDSPPKNAAEYADLVKEYAAQGFDVKAIDIAKVLNLHPMMIYRWRQEYREGKFVEKPSRRISMTKDTPLPNQNDEKNNAKDDEIKRLKKELAAAKKENDFLKKWERYLKDQKNPDLDS